MWYFSVDCFVKFNLFFFGFIFAAWLSVFSFWGIVRVVVLLVNIDGNFFNNVFMFVLKSLVKRLGVFLFFLSGWVICLRMGSAFILSTVYVIDTSVLFCLFFNVCCMGVVFCYCGNKFGWMFNVFNFGIFKNFCGKKFSYVVVIVKSTSSARSAFRNYFLFVFFG